MRSKFLILILGFCLILIPYLLWAQEGITVSGKVLDEEGEPLPGANVIIQLTNLGAATNINGDYSFNVPANAVRGQEVKLEARFIGYRTKVEKVTLTQSTDITQDFSLAIDVLDMDAIIVTGVVDETPKNKLAFSVAHVSVDAIKDVPAASAESALRGKVAGLKMVKGSGRPGGSAEIQLRGATSINANGRSQQPLYIIDGVIVDPSVVGSPMADINAEDIESIEVVKGAAGASLYGSRAANGVVNIATKRGKNLALDQTRITFRNEFGMNLLPKKLALNKHHGFKVASDSYVDDNGRNITPGDFIDNDGNWVDPREPGARVDDSYSDSTYAIGYRFEDNDYKYVSTGDIYDADNNFIEPTLLPDGPFDQIGRVFDEGTYLSNSISLSRNMESTNFYVSLNNYEEGGILPGLKGFSRRGVRLNVDHKFHRNIDISVSGYFSQSEQETENAGGINPFYSITFMAPDADLLLRNSEGTLYVGADPYSVEENPLYALETISRTNYRKRAQGSFRMRWKPNNWFNIETNASYDRSDRENDRYWPTDFETTSADVRNDGRFRRFSAVDEAINGSITAAFARAFGDLTVRAKARGLFERASYDSHVGRATDMAVREVRALELGDASNNYITSQIEDIRSEGYSLITGLDYKDRYIADFLVRKDGSSLFGEDERWNTYYRASGAYRLSQESWWPFENVEEFRLRASYGTAGGRPRFSARFETWSVSAGLLSKENLGNTELKPEFSKELEIGFNAAFLNRFTLEYSYAKTITEDQLLFVPLRAYSGYQNQWQNAGTMDAKTHEVSLSASLLQTRDMSLTFTLNFDRTRQTISELSPLVPPYLFDDIFWVKQGEEYGAMYGSKLITNLNDLPSGIDQSLFQVNDDGYVVFVGQGNSYTDGISKELWGTTSDAITDDYDNEFTYKWGYPIKWVDEEGATFTKIGSVVPDFNLGFATNFSWKGLSLYALIDAQIGGDIFNNTNQWGLREQKLGMVDQAGKAEGNKKPSFYYDALYDVNAPNSHFVEDGAYWKLRELRLSYRFNRDQLSFLGGIFNSLSIGIVGRNLFTITDYQGYDPEVGESGGQGGSSVLTRYSTHDYPNFRTFSGILEFEIF